MPVPNVRSKIVERLQFITVDGVVYNLHNPPLKAVLRVEGMGLPDSVISATQGPYQHGETPLSYRFSPRTVSVDIRHNACSASNYWTYRDTLVDTLGLQRTDPDNPIQGTLRRIYYISGVKYVRDLKVFLTGGLKFTAPPNDRWDQWGINEQLTFVAHNPILYDPTQITSAFTSFTTQLIFPMSFPFILGHAVAGATINYAGNWFEFPTITIVGPTNDVTIYNATTEKYIRFLGSISLGETVTIDLGYGSKTVTGTYGEDLLGSITPDSNLGDFCLMHNPLVANGANSIKVYVFDYLAGTTAVNIKYYNRYTGI